MLGRGFDSKLQYAAYPPCNGGCSMAHEWVLHKCINVDDEVLKLQEIVKWCFANWNEDPHYDHEWYFLLEMKRQLFYRNDKSEWKDSSVEGVRFGLGTNDDGWAASFKLAWGEFIEPSTEKIVLIDGTIYASI